VLILAAIDALGAALFSIAHAAGAQGVLPPWALFAALVVCFVAVTALWMRVEGAPGKPGGALSRLGRMAVGFVLVLIGFPGLVLMPLFALQEQLPSTAGIEAVIAPAMVILLKALVLVALVNVVGVLGLGVSAILRRWNRPAAK
jgi:phosphatidylglycerophosphate synthase